MIIVLFQWEKAKPSTFQAKHFYDKSCLLFQTFKGSQIFHVKGQYNQEADSMANKVIIWWMECKRDMRLGGGWIHKFIPFETRWGKSMGTRLGDGGRTSLSRNPLTALKNEECIFYQAMTLKLIDKGICGGENEH